MKICIIGAGLVGTSLAKKLSKENYEIAVIDIDKNKVENISLNYNVLGINCDAVDTNCLKKVKDYDLFIVVTDSDERNVAIAVLLRALFKKENMIVRVERQGFSAPPVKELLSSEMVNVTSETIQFILNIIKYPFASSLIRVENTDLMIVKYPAREDDEIVGKQIKELSPIREKVNFTVVAIERGKEAIIPNGADFIYPNDKVYIAIKQGDIENLFKLFGVKYKPVENVFVLGYSNLSEDLIEKLSKIEGISVKFIDPNISICQRISGEFPSISVFHCDLTDIASLKTEGIGNADLVVCLTDDEETNILSSIISKRAGAKKVMSLITHTEYEPIVDSIGIDTSIIPRKLVASKVYQKLTQRGISEIFELYKNVEITERPVTDEMEGKMISNLNDKKCKVIAGIKRNGSILLARGNTVIKKGDKLICVGTK